MAAHIQTKLYEKLEKSWPQKYTYVDPDVGPDPPG